MSNSLGNVLDPLDLIDKYGAVSQECCKSMVENLSKLSKSKINISITGVAGPKGGTNDKPVGLVYIGIKKGNKILKESGSSSISYDEAENNLARKFSKTINKKLCS